MTYRILITGTRQGLSASQAHVVYGVLREAVRQHPDVVLVHGACPTGVDAHVELAAATWLRSVERHSADWAAHGRAAGPIRNRRMVQLGAELCLAFPLGRSPGTRGCAALAVAAGIPTVVTEL